MRINRKFFQRDTLDIARDLLGKVIYRKVDNILIRGRILETEAYIGEADKACHARFGRTKRTQVMYGEAGHAYIYLCYGIHYLLNIVTERKNFPAGILIRKIEPLSGDTLKSYGPGNLTRYLKIDKNLNGEDLVSSRSFWIEDDGFKLANKIKKGKRIGISYAGNYINKPWRFYL